MKPNTKLVFSETPAKPVLALRVIAEISKIKGKWRLSRCDATLPRQPSAGPLTVVPIW